MHYYTTVTCFSLSDDTGLHTFYQVVVPKVGFAYKHVLHLLLSLSAMQLSRREPERQGFYLEHAERHSHAGFRIASRLLPKINHENCHSLFLFASLSCYFAILKGPRPGNFLLFDHDRPAEWLRLFCGIRTVLELHGEDIQNGILSPMIEAGKAKALKGNAMLTPMESEPLSRLRVMIDQYSHSPEDSQVLNCALDELYLLFSSRIDGEGRQVSLQLQSLGIWLFRTDGFTPLLHNRHPAALAIFAHVCIPLSDLGSRWAMGEWVPHLLDGIWNNLPRECRSCIQWPIQCLDWKPPE
jgi:hypothetical protein